MSTPPYTAEEIDRMTPAERIAAQDAIVQAWFARRNALPQARRVARRCDYPLRITRAADAPVHAAVERHRSTLTVVWLTACGRQETSQRFAPTETLTSCQLCLRHLGGS